MIHTNALTFAYPGGEPVFEGFTWTVRPGDAWTILGPSGCGKTSLLYLLAGLLQPTSGTILVQGAQLQRPRPRTGLILQDYGLLPWATVKENIALGWTVRRFYGPDERHTPADEPLDIAESRTQEWMERLGLSNLQAQYPHQLSGGQRQRTAIARTLSLGPDLLLMDEPFASLDAPTRETLQDTILALRKERALTTIAVTHAIEEAAILGEHILLLNMPPNRAPVILPNPDFQQEAFRGSNAYQALCNRLRAMMENTA